MKTKAKKIRLTVEITPLRIKRGKRQESDRCPVAIGLRAAGREAGIPGWRKVSAGIWYGLRIGTFRATPPNRVADFIEGFDQGRPVKPFTFTATFTEVA